MLTGLQLCPSVAGFYRACFTRDGKPKITPREVAKRFGAGEEQQGQLAGMFFTYALGEVNGKPITIVSRIAAVQQLAHLKIRSAPQLLRELILLPNIDERVRVRAAAELGKCSAEGAQIVRPALLTDPTLVSDIAVSLIHGMRSGLYLAYNNVTRDRRSSVLRTKVEEYEAFTFGKFRYDGVAPQWRVQAIEQLLPQFSDLIPTLPPKEAPMHRTPTLFVDRFVRPLLDQGRELHPLILRSCKEVLERSIDYSRVE